MTGRAGYLIQGVRALVPALLIALLVALTFAVPREAFQEGPLLHGTIAQADQSTGLDQISVRGRSFTEIHTKRANLEDFSRTTPSALPTRSAVESGADLAPSLDPGQHPRWAAHQLAPTHSGFFPRRGGDAAPGNHGAIVRPFPTGPPCISAVARYA